MTAEPDLDRALVQHLADLARLHLPAERLATVLQNARRIVAAFGALGDLPLESGGDPDLQPVRLRTDTAEPPLPLDQVLANAPRTAGGMFVVPRVVDG
ncbi:MAG: Asp-tRNA(Asn)/Glu-tRNA(Gln) amidotransferase GatCAB subunit C [Planctomycetes bacterium]|nr:Asp-tRNA(Asn)/Glu-tRNA(Gln) amidotransferase GatCAB subunit C [Planctomycetota bacterium]